MPLPVTSIGSPVLFSYSVSSGDSVKLSKMEYVALFGETWTTVTKHGRRSLLFPVNIRHRVTWRSKPDCTLSVCEKLVVECAVRASAI